jgi:two-component system chemotaxis sensor kinase CheA
MPRKDFDEILREFLEESLEGLQQLDTLLVQLESRQDTARLRDIFRVVRSIKGISGLLGLNQLEMLAHAGEDLLTEIRDGNLATDKEITTTLYRWSTASGRHWRWSPRKSPTANSMEAH